MSERLALFGASTRGTSASHRGGALSESILFGGRPRAAPFPFTVEAR